MKLLLLVLLLLGLGAWAGEDYCHFELVQNCSMMDINIYKLSIKLKNVEFKLRTENKKFDIYRFRSPMEIIKFKHSKNSETPSRIIIWAKVLKDQIFYGPFIYKFYCQEKPLVI
jgi:hypothetical protein